MSRILILLLGGLCASASSAATVEIRGSRTCSHWNEESGYAKSPKEMNRVPQLITKSWFLGYLSGRADESGRNVLKGTDNDSIFLWLDNYCRTNPDKALDNAGTDLIRELIKQKHP